MSEGTGSGSGPVRPKRGGGTVDGSGRDLGGWTGRGLVVDWMSDRNNRRDHAERGWDADGGSGSGGRGSGQFADGGSRPDLCDPADREERTEISPPVKSILGLVGMYPVVV